MESHFNSSVHSEPNAALVADDVVTHDRIASFAETKGWKQEHKGKIRQLYLYETGGANGKNGETLLLIASDQISAYDWVLPTPIPGKGQILTALSKFWFELLEEVVPNHYLGDVALDDMPPELRSRSMRVSHLEMYPVECVVRGYLSGSGWREYRETGEICGISLPANLQESDPLPEPIFTPATKAEVGEHDENIDFETAVEVVGSRDLMENLRETSLEIYRRAATHARERGIILADTKFEFGYGPGAEVVLADEVLTPDSSRFWPADEYGAGRPQRSFDKQYVRDWLDEYGWGRDVEPPELAPEVVENTRAKYIEAYERITDRKLD